jgi:hypothetical protein
MEELHTKLLRLKNITLNNVYMYSDEGGDTVISSIGNSAESISLNSSPIDDVHDKKEKDCQANAAGSVRTISKSISYMAIKYLYLKQLKVNCPYGMQPLRATNDALEHLTLTGSIHPRQPGKIHLNLRYLRRTATVHINVYGCQCYTMMDYKSSKKWRCFHGNKQVEYKPDNDQEDKSYHIDVSN